MTLSADLRQYADTLKAHGFTIYVPKGTGTYFVYSRMVDGRECFGDVQVEYFGGGYKHHMPIRPSRENGSSMFVGDEESEVLTVEKAEQVASPTNYNKLVGTQENYKDAAWLARGYDVEG